MDEIGRIGQTRIDDYPRQINKPAARSQAPPRVGAIDRAEFSLPARMLSKLNQIPEIRQDLVDRVRSEIDAGNYDTPDKIDAILGDLLEDLD